MLEHFILDVDGVLTDGRFFYSSEGKTMKAFGPDDHDALRLMSRYLNIQFVTGDRLGYPISQKRIVDDMGFSLTLVSTTTRLNWISERYDPQTVVYMGDGIFDCRVMRGVKYSIAPANADPSALRSASFVTSRVGGYRAVAEACLHLSEVFFGSSIN